MATFRIRLLMYLILLITMATMKLILPILLDQEIGMILIWYELIKLLCSSDGKSLQSSS